MSADLIKRLRNPSLENIVWLCNEAADALEAAQAKAEPTDAELDALMPRETAKSGPDSYPLWGRPRVREAMRAAIAAQAKAEVEQTDWHHIARVQSAKLAAALNKPGAHERLREALQAAKAKAEPLTVPETDFGNMADLLPGVVYMDPPDGGSVTLREQFERMAKDAARYRWLRDNPLWRVTYRICPNRPKAFRMIDDEGDHWGQWWPTHEQAIDAAMAAAKKEASDAA